MNLCVKSRELSFAAAIDDSDVLGLAQGVVFVVAFSFTSGLSSSTSPNPFTKSFVLVLSEEIEDGKVMGLAWGDGLAIISPCTSRLSFSPSPTWVLLWIEALRDDFRRALSCFFGLFLQTNLQDAMTQGILYLSDKPLYAGIVTAKTTLTHLVVF